MKNLIFLIFVSIVLISCNGNDNQDTVEKQPIQKQLNISILLDLSDRITVQGAQENDIENIKTITEYFKSNMEQLGAYQAKGKIRIFFSPIPENTNINTLANNLIIDCSNKSNKERKIIHDTITQLYVQSLSNIYQETKASSGWYGADIWRFFKDDVKDYCIQKDTSYRNILIILTDGYLYHEQSFYNNKNRYTYLLGSNINNYRTQNWKELIERDNFGIITERNDLQNIEVLILEVKSETNKLDEDLLKYTWRKWLQEMNVAHYEVYSSDLPVNTKTRIESFLNTI